MKVNAETLLSLLAGTIAFMFGKDAEKMQIVFALMTFIAFDIITGFFKAFYNKNFKSGVLEKGLFKKVLILVSVSFGYYIDKFGFIDIGVSLESALTSFFIVGEVVSVFENLADMGLKFPKQVISYINKLHEVEGVDNDGK